MLEIKQELGLTGLWKLMKLHAAEVAFGNDTCESLDAPLRGAYVLFRNILSFACGSQLWHPTSKTGNR